MTTASTRAISSPDRPAINQAFFEFLDGPAGKANSLYILGDLFEYWAGDDDLDDSFNALAAQDAEAFMRADLHFPDPDATMMQAAGALADEDGEDDQPKA